MGDSLVLQVKDKQIQINKQHIEEFRRTVYQVPDTFADRIEKIGIDRTGQNLEKKGFSESFFKGEVQRGHFIRRR